MDARRVRGRRAADAARRAIRLLDIGAPREAPGSSSTSRRPPSRSARRPDRLAVYTGCCADRRQGHVTCATHDGRPTGLDTDTAEAKAPPSANHEPLLRPPRRGSLELRSCSSSGPGASPTVTRTLALRRERARGALVSAQGRALAHDGEMCAVPAKQERAAVASRASLCSEPALRAITAGMPGRCRCEPIALRGLSELVPTQLSSGGPKAVALGRRSESLAAPHAE